MAVGAVGQAAGSAGCAPSGSPPDLTRRVSRGEYVVDAHAVADAIIRRGRARVVSGVLVPAQLFDDLAAGKREADAAARGGVA